MALTACAGAIAVAVLLDEAAVAFVVAVLGGLAAALWAGRSKRGGGEPLEGFGNPPANPTAYPEFRDGQSDRRVVEHPRPRWPRAGPGGADEPAIEEPQVVTARARVTREADAPAPAPDPPDWVTIRERSRALAFREIAPLVDAAIDGATDPYAAARSAIRQRLGQERCELIWCYWHDEAHIEEALEVIRTSGAEPPDRLGRLLSGMEADESRVTIKRRAAAYEAAYGFRIGRSPPPRREQFAHALAVLLRRAALYYRDLDNVAVRPDALPIAHALAGLQPLLDMGSRPDREFDVNARTGVLLALYVLQESVHRSPVERRLAAPEPWMLVVDDVTARSGRRQPPAAVHAQLATLGERILLSVRSRNWVPAEQPDDARRWVEFWRCELQNYVLASEAARRRPAA